MYRIWCKFEPHHINPMTARRGQWRVVSCREMRGERLITEPCHQPLYGWTEIGIASTKPYPRGSIIRPHRELNRVLAARRSKAA